MNNEIGLEVLDLQIKALKRLKNTIKKSFYRAVKKISSCKSKIIICGVGKSGIIASKISATLASVGCPSFSISANDCSHGDLGRITNDDVLILISYSGNTEELKNVINYAKSNKIFLIGITSNKNSYLNKSSNIKLEIPKVREAGFGIVPTSSTTIQLALGDAIAMEVMQKKGFKKIDFKKFHPGGNLGQKLKTISEIMLTDKKIPFINENEIMKNALKILDKKKLGFLVVINNQGHNTGVFTDGDLKRLLQKKKFIEKIKIKYLMTKNPFKVNENSLATDVINLMNKKKITNACVFSGTKKNKIIGVIHIHNLIKELN